MYLLYLHFSQQGLDIMDAEIHNKLTLILTKKTQRLETAWYFLNIKIIGKQKIGKIEIPVFHATSSITFGTHFSMILHFPSCTENGCIFCSCYTMMCLLEQWPFLLHYQEESEIDKQLVKIFQSDLIFSSIPLVLDTDI